MLVTALNRQIGYDKTVRNGKLAFAENITLKPAADPPDDFDRSVVPGATPAGGGG